jgi:putative addiction module component (TIGR02574 family)
MSLDAILKEAEALSLQERAELVERLEQGLIEAGWEETPELSAELKALLDERERENETSTHPGYTIDEVMAYLKRKR